VVEKVIDVLIPTKTGYNIKKVGENEMMNQIKEFDESFPDGVFSLPRPSKEPRVKVRALHDYCKEKGVAPEELSNAEIERFLI